VSRKLGWAAVVLGGVLALIQWVPVERSNPPVETELPATPQVSEVLRRACYDCHSNETVWPWYASIAPVSWLIARDVNEGREELNFSTWNRYDAKQRTERLEGIAEMVEEGEMPPWFYLPFHRDARLSAADVSALEAWTGPRPAEHRGHHHHHEE